MTDLSDSGGPRSFARCVAAGGALGLVLVPFVLWGAAPGLVARLESSSGFLWVGETTGAPLLLREQFDGHQVVAGSDRHGLPRDEPLRCYDGDLAPLRAAAQARGRIDDIVLEPGSIRRLTITVDDLGGGQASYLYRCGPKGAQPLLSLSSLPGFGVRALASAWLAWVAGTIGALALARGWRTRDG